MQVMGKSVARVNDSLSCGCELLPQQTLVVGDTGPGQGSEISNERSQNLVNSFVSTALFDEELILQSDDGNFLAKVPFFITDEAGNTYQGISKEDGSCGRIKTNNKQTLDVLLGVLALEKWNGS
jgi:hypothetical protein